MTHKLIKTDNYLLIVDDHKDIEENMWTIKDGKVREVSYLGQDNGYAIIAHLPLNNATTLEGIPLLPPIEDDVEYINNSKNLNDFDKVIYIAGYNKAREKFRYTEEDMRKAIAFGGTKVAMKESLNSSDAEDFIQSLSQYPTEFESEWIPCNPIKYTVEDHLVCEPKTTTNAQGQRVWVGKYN